MKKVLVTGGAGYIGSCVVEKLLERGHHPVVFDTFFWGYSPVEAYRSRATFYEGDVRNSRDIVHALQGCDAVIHLAGLVGAPACDNNPLAHFTTNVESTNTLINCMTDPEVGLVRDFVYCSSCSIYGNVAGIYDQVDEDTPFMPLSSYADGKIKAERIIFDKAKAIPHFTPTVLRLTTIFGWSPRPRLDLVTNLFAHKALNEGRITIFGNGLQYRSLIHVWDVADALVHALDTPRYLRDRQVFHVGEEENNVTLRWLAEKVKEYVPGTEVEYSSEVSTDRRDYQINCQKIKNALNWRASYSAEAGLKEMVEKLREGNINPDAPEWRNNGHNYQ